MPTEKSLQLARARDSSIRPACQARAPNGTYCVMAPSRRITACADTRSVAIAGEGRVGSRRQIAGEQPIDPRAAEFAGRQADAMNDDQLRLRARRAGIEMRRQHLAHAEQQAGDRIDVEASSCMHEPRMMPKCAHEHSDQFLARARDLQHVWHPCTQMKDHEQLPPIPMRRAQGVLARGLRRPPLPRRDQLLVGQPVRPLRIRASTRRSAAQLQQLEHVMLAGFTHEPAIALAEELVRIAPPGLTRCFYADNGSAAVEVALKMSFHYWQNQGQPAQAPLRHAQQQLPRRDTRGAGGRQRRALQEHLRAAADGRADGAVAGLLRTRARRELGASTRGAASPLMARALEQHADEIAAVIVEPLVQCAGGMRMYDPVYLSLLRERLRSLRRAPDRR